MVWIGQAIRKGAMMVWANEMERLLGKMMALLDDDDAVRLVDQGGLIFTRSEWEEMKGEIDKFYQKYSDEAIEIHNQCALTHKSLDYIRNLYDGQRPKRNKIAAGYVYLLHHDGLYKIGKANSVPERSKQLGIQMPHEVTVVHSIYSDDPMMLESQLHAAFAEKRMGGEWFRLDDDDVRMIMAEGGQDDRSVSL